MARDTAEHTRNCREPAESPTDYSQAKLVCDVVMKGGISSGLIYPTAVCRLAREYRFRCVGGTSAGAIAAAATAAAEYGRMKGQGQSFRGLETLPKFLGEKPERGVGSRMFGLFQPQPETERLFKTLVAGIRGKPRIRRIAVAAVGNYWLHALLGGGAVLLLAVLLASVGGSVRSGFTVASSWVPWLLLTVVGGLTGISLGVARDIRNRVPANDYGLSTGMGGPEALTPWLHKLLQDLSGKPDDKPLTFGDLWGDDASRKEIDLQMLTTCLTQGRPYRLPFTDEEADLFFFRCKDLERLFPDPVVKWMVGNRRPCVNRSEDLIPFPRGRDLPVIVATRLSLSFPFLISAVPLRGIDQSRSDGDSTPEVCWFSDGGISSNFPVHFFDAPLPGWPTFAINLRYFEKKPEKRVVMPRDNDDGTADAFHHFEEKKLAGFARAIFDAMQNWQDNAQAKMPGFRDRIAHIGLAAGEGGLNIDMTQDEVTEIARIGAEAGDLLAERFALGSREKLNWENHRWVRFRSAMASLEKLLERLGPRLAPEFEPPRCGDENFAALVERGAGSLPSYPWGSPEQQEEAIRTVRLVVKLADDCGKEQGRLSAGAPEPMPELRARPKI